MMDRQAFERIQNFRNSGNLINSENLKTVEIKFRIFAGNRCYCSLRQIFRSTAMSKSVEIKIYEYKKMVQPVAVFGSKTWAVAEMDMNRLGKEEREILRLVHGPMVEQGMWRIRTDQELKEIYKL